MTEQGSTERPARRCRSWLWVAAVLAAPAAAGGQTADEMAEAGRLIQEAFDARSAEDLDAYLDRLTRAEALRPGHPELLYMIAGAYALRDETDQAVAHLDRVARMGLGLQADADPDFVTLADDPAFQDVVARIQANRDPRGTARTAFIIPGEADFVPEGIAFDDRDRAYFIGSVHKRKILRVDSSGVITEFAAPGEGGLMSAMGMLVDTHRRALWVATAGVPETSGITDEERGRSALFRYDLDTRALMVTYHFSNRDEQRVVGDLSMAEDGDVYASDARGSGIYRLRANGDFLETFVQPGVFRSPQGMAVSADQRALYIADYSKGIFRVNRLTREARRMPYPTDATLLGIDGLVRHGDALLAIQNGTAPHRILRLDLSPDGTSITRVGVLASNLPEWDEPTLGLMVDGRLYYVANSQWNRFVDGELPAESELADPRIMWLDPG